MVNVSKIKTLAKCKGITFAFICSSVGMQRGYLNDVAAGKTNMPEERIRKIAEILGTTYEYLTDKSDDTQRKHMVNVTKIKELAKLKGLKIGYLCDKIGVGQTYIADVARGRNSMPEDRIRTIAEILDTSYEYLTDQTNDMQRKNMVNIDKIKELAKIKGITTAFLCSKIGKHRGYLKDVARSERPNMPEEYIRTIAEILDTSYGYLTDQTNDIKRKTIVNIAKIKTLCISKGIKQKYLCEQFGIGATYLNDVAKGKNTMSEDRIRTIAEILNTSYEYLTDQTDDPVGPEAKQSLEMFDLLADAANPIANRFSAKEMRDIVFDVTPDQLAEYITASHLQTKKAPDKEAEDLQRKIFDKVLEMHEKTKLEAVLKMLEVMG